jgi:opacity protein-like surface antigen
MTLHVLMALTGFVLQGASARAQDVAAPLVRADISVGAGWHHARVAAAGEYDEWYHDSVSGSATAGWYWTDHLKTELDLTTTSPGRVNLFTQTVVNGQNTFRYGWIDQGTSGVALAQTYQFFDNAWFHPYVGAGLDVVRETTDEHIEPLTSFDRVTGRPRIVDAARGESSARWLGRPVVAAGFKAYMTRRSYFKTDARVRASRRVDDLVIRVGVGIDVGR